jgi:multicomponent Na+:H+ antiporter subunit B
VVSVIVLTRPREPRDDYVGEDVAGQREQRETDPARPHGHSERAARTGDAEELGERLGPETPDAEPLGTPRPERAQGMTVVVRSGVRLVLPLLTVAGCYLVAWGYSPGGGFPGGAVVLGVVLLVYVAYGYRRIARVVRPRVTETVELLGAGAIIVIELLGLVLRGSVSANWLPLTPPQTIRSGGVVQAFSVGEFVEVASGLVIVAFALLGVRHDWAGGDEDDDGAGAADRGDAPR